MTKFMKKAGWVMYAGVLVCFLLPFFLVKCNDFTLAEVSGVCLVTGCTPDTEMEGMGGDDEEKQEMEPVDKQPWAIAALALAVIGLCLTFVRTKFAWMGSGIVAVLGLAALILLYVKATGDLPDAAGGDTKKDKTGEVAAGDGADPVADMGEELGNMIDKDVKITIEAGLGFFGAFLFFLLAAIGSFLTMNDRSPPAAAGPAGGYAPPGFGPGSPGGPSPGGGFSPPVGGGPPTT